MTNDELWYRFALSIILQSIIKLLEQAHKHKIFNKNSVIN